MTKFTHLVLATLTFLVFSTCYGGTMNTKEYKLDNGLKIVVREDHRAPVAVAQVWYRVGSGDEYPGITGISHALEHMMFKGSKKFPGDTYSETISRHGGNDNAFTTDDFTAYYAELDVSKLELSFELEADRMQNLIVSAEDFAKEKQVVKEERRLRTDDNPQNLTYERFLAAAHVAGPYHHPVIGWMHDIEQLTAEDLSAWYQNWYGPNNAVLVVVGDVDPAAIYELAKKHFGPVTKQAKRHTKKFAEIAPLGEKRIQVKAPAELPFLVMGFEVPSLSTLPKEKAYVPYALMVAGFALDGGNSSRFAKEIVRGSEIALDTHVDYDAFKRHDSLFVLTGVPTAKNTVDKLEQALWLQLEKLKTEPLNDLELKKIKTQIIAGQVFEKDSMSDQAIMLGLFESVGLGWQEADDYVKKIKQVTPAQVQEVAKQYFNRDSLTVATLVPQPIQQES